MKIMVAIPTEGATPAESYDNRLLLAFHLGKLEAKHPDKYEFYWGTVGRVLVPLARERLAEFAYANKIDKILFIDDDMITDVDLFEKLNRNDVDVVAALAFTRTAPHNPVIYSVTEGYEPTTNREYFINKVVRNYPKNKLFECDAVGFGAVLIKTKILEKMKKSWFMSTTGSGEDIYFCHKAKKEAGARIFVDTSVKIGHLGNHPIITEETYEKYNNNDEYRKVYGDFTKPPAVLSRSK